jgi:phage-related protein
MTMPEEAGKRKKLFFEGDSRERLREAGLTPANAKAKSRYGKGVLELSEDCADGTFRTAYIAKLKSGIYVLHAYQKKSKTGIATPAEEIAKIQQRLKQAMENDRIRQGGTGHED